MARVHAGNGDEDRDRFVVQSDQARLLEGMSLLRRLVARSSSCPAIMHYCPIISHWKTQTCP